MISPHFPPDTSAATHRVRLLAPHLPSLGWEPTVLTVEPRDYEGVLDPDLARLVSASLRVVRCRALPVRGTRLLGFGDLGLRALSGLRRHARRLLSAEPFDALFITTYPVYPALLGPALKWRFGVPFVLDLQDPWVGAWGETVGGGPSGAVDLKSRLSLRLMKRLEPFVAGAADAITAVSAETIAALVRRHPWLGAKLNATIPIGGDPADFDATLLRTGPNAIFDPGDGRYHIAYVGTLLPRGLGTLRAFLSALAEVVERDSGRRRMVVHFVGTSNQSTVGGAPRVLPIARELGVAAYVTERPQRLPYLEALRVLADADATLLLGSDEPHYTASKIYPALLCGRPILALYHAASEGLQSLSHSRLARVVPYSDPDDPKLAREAATALSALLTQAPVATTPALPAEFSAHSLAGRLAAILDSVAASA